MSLISVIIEGIVAGLTGAFAALFSIHFQNKSNRRTAHLIKHKQNFQVIEDAIRKTCSDVAPCTKMDSKEEPDIEMSYADNSDIWESYSIFNHWSQSKEQSTDNEIGYVTINMLLYKDIQKHWDNLYKKLNKWIGSIHDTGQTLSKSTKYIFNEIENNLDQGKLNEAISKSLHNKTTQTLTSKHIYLAIYNLLKDYNKNEWPHLCESIKTIELERYIKEIADTLKKNEKVKEELAKLSDVAPPFLHLASEIIDELEQIMLSEKIEGSCEYI